MPTPVIRARPALRMPSALSIAGSDSGGGAGIQADLLTFAAHGVYGTTAITCLTAQNPDGVSGVHAAPAAFVGAQIEAVISFFSPKAAKTGMLYNAAIVTAVAAVLDRHPRIQLVVDPVMVATSGAVLLERETVEALGRRLFPRATLITPNLDEAAVLLGRRPENRRELTEAAVQLARRYGTATLLKGGHLQDGLLHDVLATPRGPGRTFTGRRITGVDTHGSGCTLAAGIAAQLALGRTLPDAVAVARRYLRRGMMGPVRAGGRSFITH